MYVHQFFIKNAGYTLIEIVISIVLLGILSIIGANMVSDTFSMTNFVARDTSGVSSARYAIERLGREIRESQTILSNSNSQLSFVKNSGTTISITAVDKKVLLGSGAAASILVDNVDSFGLTYLDANQGAPADTNAIRFVQISLTVTPTSGPSITLSTRIAIRAQA